MLDSTQIWLQRLAWLLSWFIYFYSTSNPRVTSIVGCLTYGLTGFSGSVHPSMFSTSEVFMRRKRKKIKNLERTPKEKLGLSEVSFHIRGLLNSDCSVCSVQTRDCFNSVINCPVIYPLEPRPSFSLHLKLSSGRSMKILFPVCMAQTGYINIWNIC